MAAGGPGVWLRILSLEPPDWQSCRDCEGQPRSHRPQQPRFGDKDKEGVTQGRTDVWHGWTRSKGSHCVSHTEKTTVRCCEEPRVRIWKKEHTHTHHIKAIKAIQGALTYYSLGLALGCFLHGLRTHLYRYDGDHPSAPNGVLNGDRTNSPSHVEA